MDPKLYRKATVDDIIVGNIVYVKDRISGIVVTHVVCDWTEIENLNDFNVISNVYAVTAINQGYPCSEIFVALINKEKFLNLVDPKPYDWSQTEKRIANRYWVNTTQKIALKVLVAMTEQNLSKEEVVKNLDITLEEFNKFVKGNSNIDIKTIIDLERFLNIQILNIAD